MSVRTAMHLSRLALRGIIPVLVALLALTGSSYAQERKIPQNAGVGNSKMGPYRALAQLAFSASQKGDNATAATLAKPSSALGQGGRLQRRHGPLKNNRARFDEVDRAMDQFIALLLEHANSAPDPAKLKAVYTNYLDKLKLAD